METHTSNYNVYVKPEGGYFTNYKRINKISKKIINTQPKALVLYLMPCGTSAMQNYRLFYKSFTPQI